MQDSLLHNMPPLRLLYVPPLSLNDAHSPASFPTSILTTEHAEITPQSSSGYCNTPDCESIAQLNCNSCERSDLSCWMDLIDELIDQPPDYLTSISSLVRDTPPISNFTQRQIEKRSSDSSQTVSFQSLKWHTEKLDQLDNVVSSTSLSQMDSQQDIPIAQSSSSFPPFVSSSGQAQQHQHSGGSKVVPGSDPRLVCLQSPNNLRKALSAPQLNQLDNIRTRKRRSTLPLPVPPAFNSPTGPRPTLQEGFQPSGWPKSSFYFSETNDFTSTLAKSPANFPTSLPSANYLSTDIERGSNTLPLIQPIHRRAVSLQHNMPLTMLLRGQQERVGDLQQQQLDTAQLRRCHPEEAQDTGLRLVHLLLACAEAVAREDYITAEELILQLQQRASVTGNSMQRVAAYFTDALRSRLTGTGNKFRGFDPVCSEEVIAAYRIFYQACPYLKFAHFTSNQAIFEAFEGEERVHIVDLDILEGFQWPAFLQALAVRPGGPPFVRITGVGMSLDSLQATGKRLDELARFLHVPFEFHPVAEKLENVKPYMLQRRIGEALAVNSINRLHRLLSESIVLLAGILHMIREQAPKILALVEQEASHNNSFFLGRFLEALHYYSAIFDSLEATLAQNSTERRKVEQIIFGKDITNIVGCEGSERLERHEKLGRWRKMMDGIGFSSVNVSAKAVDQSKLLLGLYPCDGYTLEEDKGCLVLGWQDRPIVAMSSWRC